MIAVVVIAACGADDDDQASTAASPTASPPTNELPEGSGCTPGTGHLPDGIWYGHVVATSIDELQFDLACWFIGEAATVASAEDGQESPPPNGYHVRNTNARVGTVPVAGNVPVTWYGMDPSDPSNEALIDYGDWITDRQDRRYQLPVWLTLESGAITQIHEQWTP